jgi:hypothetical protein
LDEIFEIDHPLLCLGTVNEAFLVNPSKRSHRGELTTSDGALDVKPRDVLRIRKLALVFRQDASSSAPLCRHTNLLSCLDVNITLVDDWRPTPGDCFIFHLLFKGFVVTIGMVEPTADAVVDLVLPRTTGSICKVLLPDLLTGVEVVVRPIQTVD